MFELLPLEKYLEVIPLFDHSRFINAVRSHLERTLITKEVYVDDLQNPQTVAILVRHRAFIGGNSQNREFNEKLRDYLLVEKRKELENYELFELDFYVSSNDWLEVLISLFPYSYNAPRHYYEIREIKMKDWRDRLPDGYKIEPVDLSLLQRKNLENFDWLEEEIEENWLPFEEHLKEVRGYYIVYKEKEIVAWCTSEYLTADKHIEVGIATRSEHQKKGLATIVGSATADLCLAKYKTIGWHSAVINVGSNKTAESIGFEKIKDYSKVGYFFNKLDNFIVLGYRSFLKKNYDEAIRFYELVLDAHMIGDEDALTSGYLTKWGFTIDKLTMEYASFYAASGKQEECLEKIGQAVDLGYNNIEAFENEELFKILYSRPEWVRLKEAIRKNKGE